MTSDSVRAGYDAVAAQYAETFRTELDGKPMLRAMLTAFAEYVPRGGPVLEAGCGPGEVTAFLHGLGLDVSGLDLSPEMVAVARAAHPGLRFEEGSMTALPVPDGTLAGLVAFYSIIHTEPEDLPALFAEFHRALAPGGYLLLAFQARNRPVRLTNGFGRAVTLHYPKLDPSEVAELLADAGFSIRSRLVSAPDSTERSRQAQLLARR